ncbi:hypothetical protein B0T20DRAFT_425690 [Sordaria brevicollis]|uniref:Secreted protein n=1 Tax=Sordaria brevicollis TaxID=83679 RepID=A0AAE0NVH7_SORBR|nr:hypothetical protein B0T20DRAFT_425690 [Sordaria brevicollis]
MFKSKLISLAVELMAILLSEQRKSLPVLISRSYSQNGNTHLISGSTQLGSGLDERTGRWTGSRVSQFVRDPKCRHARCRS